MKTHFAIWMVAIVLAMPVLAADKGAHSLVLAPGLSFTDDSSDHFPIRGENMNDGLPASDRPTMIFFGKSHCYNTSREAERFVTFYARHHDDVLFLVVDLDHPSPVQQLLIRRYYRGGTPTITLLDAKGSVVYDKAGETAFERGDVARLEEILKKAR
jgi:hypothetical protein